MGSTKAEGAGRAVMVTTIVPDQPQPEPGTERGQRAAARCTLSTSPMARSVATKEEPP
jgi:hypothetical protein